MVGVHIYLLLGFEPYFTNVSIFCCEGSLLPLMGKTMSHEIPIRGSMFTTPPVGISGDIVLKTVHYVVFQHKKKRSGESKATEEGVAPVEHNEVNLLMHDAEGDEEAPAVTNGEVIQETSQAAPQQNNVDESKVGFKKIKNTSKMCGWYKYHWIDLPWQ